jgi:hypothetical protein
MLNERFWVLAEGAPMIRAGLSRWLSGPVLTGWRALACGSIAVALPTLVRAAINGEVTGCEFTPYVPFLLVAAILLRWWQASLVAIAAVAIMGGLFEGLLSRHVIPACFAPSATVFLAASAGLIAFASVLRRLIAGLQKPNEEAGGVVFSLDRGEVWASWYGHAHPLRLGTRRKVARMMEDFLKQEDLARRLGSDEADRSAPKR